ncbi:tRNA1Val (adenine37-N6)-methyltransferase [Vibrio xiamenensis]|uniref:tRNA1(Val) (adenine(37)-N6)-methyltransferase n=2 Tax=Vibrio xiamenensis TaxID=861298 RepID=A0A1G8B159_9VIBR|nr:tRNA1Val (adenine37-N6)-methyltransferase [Vibrio xiamenensis]
MAVSTDGVLLGAWTQLNDAKTVLDIGTGTGLLALMCAQRRAHAQITAIEIDDCAIASATGNIERSPWQSRITLIQSDAREAQFDNLFEVIICNPPYFLSGEQAQMPQRAKARHSDHLDHQILLSNCAKWLTEDGQASFILPVVEGRAFIASAKHHGLFASRVCQVSPTEHKAPNRLLIELRKHQQTCVKSTLTIREKQAYSGQFTALTKDFYLKM